MPDVDRVARRPYRKIVGRATFLFALVCLGFLYPAPVVLTVFVCPGIALALAATAVGRLGPWSGSPDAARFMEGLACALLYAGIPNAVLALALCASEFTRSSRSILYDPAAWLWTVALLVPQLFWASGLRASRWFALLVALVSLAASAEFWYELHGSLKW